jgi:mRNA interferase MazF
VRRGEAYRLKHSTLTRGHEQRGDRYAVVVQNDEIWHTSTILIVPTSTKVFETDVHIPLEKIAGGATYALCEQLMAVDPNQRLGEYVGYVSLGEEKLIDDSLRLLLDLDRMDEGDEDDE